MSPILKYDVIFKLFLHPQGTLQFIFKNLSRPALGQGIPEFNRPWDLKRRQFLFAAMGDHVVSRESASGRQDNKGHRGFPPFFMGRRHDGHFRDSGMGGDDIFHLHGADVLPPR